VRAARLRTQVLVAGCIGNFVEWYDFALYGAFATVLARAFVPGTEQFSRLLAAFASGLSLTYGLSSTVFGGRAPLVATFLVQRTGNGLLPAWYVTCVSAAALGCAFVARETAPGGARKARETDDSSMRQL
jgi:MFS transporter, MHS family, proline/betaine transporter